MLSACALALSILSLCCYVSAASSASALLLLLHRPTTIRTAPRLSPPPTFLPLCRRATPKEHPIHRPVILSSTSSSKKNDVYIAFPGGGLFFYWQAGVIVSCSVNKYNCSTCWADNQAITHRLRTADLFHFFPHGKIIFRPTCEKQGTIYPNHLSRVHPRVPCRQPLPNWMCVHFKQQIWHCRSPKMPMYGNDPWDCRVYGVIWSMNGWIDCCRRMPRRW